MPIAFLGIFNSILGSIREPLIVLGPNLKVVTANHSFYHTFKVKPDETEGVLIYDLGNRQWDIPKLRELLEHILPQNTSFHDFEVEHNFETIGCKIMHLNARRIYGEGDQLQLILLAIEDVTEREYYKRHLQELVEQRTAELSAAREEAEKAGKQPRPPLLKSRNSKTSLKPKEPIFRKKSNWYTTMRTSSVKAMPSITCFTKLNKSLPPTRMF